MAQLGAMIDFVKKYFGPGDDKEAAATSSHHDIRVATCALFLEMANLDDEFSGTEKEDVLRLMREHYGLSAAHAEELASIARQELDGSIDLWRFTNLINQNYSRHEKMQIVELIWRLIYADGRLSEHENYLVRKLGKMLRLNHRELIECKLAVLHDGDDRVT
jgi:uncharacterized tellurite resistance protein B-like protein